MGRLATETFAVPETVTLGVPVMVALTAGVPEIVALTVGVLAIFTLGVLLMLVSTGPFTVTGGMLTTLVGTGLLFAFCTVTVRNWAKASVVDRTNISTDVKTATLNAAKTTIFNLNIFSSELLQVEFV